MQRFAIAAAAAALLAACGHSGDDGNGNTTDAARGRDASAPHDGDLGGDARPSDAGNGSGSGDLDAGAHDAGSGSGGAHDGGAAPDAAVTGPITGGPCASGAAGATAFRITWTGTQGGTASVQYDVDGLPDHSREHAEAYGYQIGFEPTFDDTFLGTGGVVLDDDDFIDLKLTTAGVTSIQSASLAILGRSFNVDTPGSFSWQTFDGTGAAPTDLVSNSAPYQWYAADMTTEISPGDTGLLIRIYAGPASDTLVVHSIELCMRAE